MIDIESKVFSTSVRDIKNLNKTKKYIKILYGICDCEITNTCNYTGCELFQSNFDTYNQIELFYELDPIQLKLVYDSLGFESELESESGYDLTPTPTQIQNSIFKLDLNRDQKSNSFNDNVQLIHLENNELIRSWYESWHIQNIDKTTNILTIRTYAPISIEYVQFI